MKIQTLVLGPMANCTYIISKNDNAVVIDPAWEMEEIEHNLKGAHLCAVFFTHGHFDHVKDVAPFLKSYDIKAFIDERDWAMSQLPAEVIQTYQAPQKMQICGFDIDILHTPGHSEGSVCIKIEDNLFTGDTLFPGACGRVDLPFSSPRKMRQSLYELAQLPPQTKVYAGHTYGQDGSAQSTIAKELENNQYMINSVRDLGKK